MKKNNTNNYDEKQLADRGKAFEYGYISLLGSLLASCGLNTCVFDNRFSCFTVCYFSMWVSIVFLSCYLIRINAYTRPKDEKTFPVVMVIFGVCGISDALLSIRDIIRDYDDNLWHIFYGVGFLIIAVYYFIHRHNEKKKALDDEE